MAGHHHHGSDSKDKLRGGEWRTLGILVPYLLEFRGRVILALALLASPTSACRW